jgi:cytochrome c-type biogenesis protein CcmH
MRYLFALIALLMVAAGVAAQDDEVAPEPQPTRVVTMDDINAVAERMYCPVCENEPLDTCMATTCVQWRNEIRAQLQQGRTPDQVIDSFVAQHGDVVLGVPRDPLQRFLTFAGPVLLVIAGISGGLWLIRRWPGSQGDPSARPEWSPSEGDMTYRSQLEDDLNQ